MLRLLGLLSNFFRSLSRIHRFGLYTLLATGIVFLCWVSSVQAAKTVLLQYRDLKTQVSLTDLNAFVADSDSSPALQQFWQDTNQNPTQVKEWLTAKISLPPASQLIDANFALLQINKTLGDPLGRENLDPLKTAFKKSLQSDRAFSILELLQNYPSAVRLEVSRLEQAYNNANLLITRIQPVLKTAEALLPELLCECKIAATEPVSKTAKPDLQAKNAVYDSNAVKFLLSAELSAELSTAMTIPVSNVQSSVQSNVQGDLTQAALSSSAPSLANKRLVMQFGPFGRSISLQDLTRFAETGELSRGWKFFFNVAGVSPADVQSALNQEVAVRFSVLDRTLNNLLGEFLLYQIGQVVHTRSNTANIQALRSASVLAAFDDNHLSLLEVLQRYPTSQVYIDGLRLARLGQRATRFQAEGGVRAAAVSLEDWLVQLQASTAENLCNCEQQAKEQENSPLVPVTPTISSEQVAKFLPANWQPVAAHRADRGIIKVVWLQGSPYEMGYQHGQYLHDEIASLGSNIIEALRFAGRGLALGRLAAKRSYPEIVEECRGLTDATQDIGMTLDACFVLAYGDVYQEIFGNTLPNILFWDGCSQWVAAGNATVDGRLYHGSTLDNDQKPIDYIMNNPVVFVRQPNDGLPHVSIAYPGVVWPNWGLNVAGITLGLDSAHPQPNELSFQGGSNVQIMAQILRTATSFAEARQIMETQPRVHADLLMITDGKSKQAGVFEFTGKNLAVRELQENGVLYMTNHMVSEAMFNRQRTPLDPSSLTRFKRFGQLMEPGANSYYGEIDPVVMTKIGRDRVNPNTLEPSPFDLFDDDASPGGNGSLRQGLYDPDKLLLWVAGGQPPVPENPFVCFSLGEMLNFPNATPCPSPAL